MIKLIGKFKAVSLLLIIVCCFLTGKFPFLKYVLLASVLFNYISTIYKGLVVNKKFDFTALGMGILVFVWFYMREFTESPYTIVLESLVLFLILFNFNKVVLKKINKPLLGAAIVSFLVTVGNIFVGNEAIGVANRLFSLLIYFWLIFPPVMGVIRLGRQAAANIRTANTSDEVEKGSETDDKSDN